MSMAARKHDYDYDLDLELDFGRIDHDPTLDACFHDRPGTAMRSGVVPVSRTTAPAPFTIPRASSVSEFVVGKRESGFVFHEAPRPFPIGKLFAATVVFIAKTVLAAIAYYR
jgi:hypothetical protein